MTVKTIRQRNEKCVVFALICLSGILLLYLLDYALIGYDNLHVDFVHTEPLFWMRTVLLFLTALLLVGYLVRERGRAALETAAGPEAGAEKLQFNLPLGFRVAFSPAWLVLGSLLFALISVGIFLYEPFQFYEIGREDKIVEILSALFALLAGINFVYLLVNSLHGQIQSTWIFKLAAGVLALSLILLSMEEISWFQRAFWMPTPEVLGGNLQNEINLHNFATNQIENVYYFVSFLFLIALPFIHYTSNLLRGFPKLAFFIPSLTVLLVSAPMAAFNNTEWNMSTVQVAFFATLLMLLYLLVQGFRQPGSLPVHPLLVLGVLVLLPVAQLIFVLMGDRFIRAWDVTEYKELFIPLGFIIYSLEMMVKTVKIIPTRIVMTYAGITGVFAVLRLLQKYTM